METILIAAISLDGFITKHDEPGSGFTSREDKAWFHETVKEFDSLVFGSANYEISRGWMKNHLREDQLKLILTRRPEDYRAEEVPGSLDFHSGDARSAVRRLAEAGKRRCAVLGGGKIYHLFLRGGCVDELWLTVEPLLFGRGISLATGELDVTLDLLETRHLAPSTLLLKYRPRRDDR